MITTPTDGRCMLRFSVKERLDGGRWENVQAEEFAGKSIKQALLALADREAVAELVIDGRSFYLCSSPHWVERMQNKGKAMLIKDAINTLQGKMSELLHETIPSAAAVAEVFPGATLEAHTTGGSK